MPYILLHGLGQSASSWARTTDALQIPADDVLCPELSDWLRGHEPRYDGLYQAFTAYCSGFSQPLDLCGLSLGGILALQYAIENSSRVHSLVLIGAQSSMPRRLLRLQNAIFRFLPARAFASTGFGKKEFLGLCSSLMDLDLSPGLRNVACPVLVLCGENDRANKSAAQQLHAQLSQSELLLIPRAGHEVNVDAPDALAQALRSFWAV